MVGAFAVGAAVGVGIEKTLDVSSVAAEHGMAVEKALTSHGVSKDTAMIFGATMAGRVHPGLGCVCFGGYAASSGNGPGSD